MQELQVVINSKTPLGHFIYSLRELGSRFARSTTIIHNSKIILSKRNLVTWPRRLGRNLAQTLTRMRLIIERLYTYTRNLMKWHRIEKVDVSLLSFRIARVVPRLLILIMMLRFLYRSEVEDGLSANWAGHRTACWHRKVSSQTSWSRDQIPLAQDNLRPGKIGQKYAKFLPPRSNSVASYWTFQRGKIEQKIHF